MTRDLIGMSHDVPAGETKTAALPEGWRVVRLGDVCDMVMGQSPPSDTYNSLGHGMAFLQGKADFTDLHPRPEKYCTLPLKIGVKGSVLMSVRAPVGDVNLADRDYIIGRGLASLRLRMGNDYFLFYLLLFNQQKIAELGSGTTFQSINKATLDGFPILLPPLAEQRAIASTLRAAQAAVQARRRAVELERERKAALMQTLLSGKAIKPQSGKAEADLPEGWRLVKLGQIARLESGGTPSKERPDWWQGTIPWVSPKDLKQPRLRDVADHITEEALANGSRLAPAGALFIVVRGMILAKDIPVALTEVPMAFNQDLKAILPSKEVLPEYLLYALVQRKDDMIHIIGSSAHGTRRIGSEDLEATILPLPPLAAQREIAATLRACDEVIAGLERETGLHEELFRALLEELMTGRVRAVKR